MLQGKVEKVLDLGKNGKSGKGSIYNSRYICNDRVSQCSPKSHSLKRCSSSSAPSGPISYGFDRIKLHQVQVMSPVLLIHLSLRSTASPRRNRRIACAVGAISRKDPVVCMTGKELQDNARHAKPGCCETTSSFVQWQVWKDPRNHMGHGAPSNMWLSQTARLVLWLVLSGWRRHHVLSVRQVKHPMGSTGMSPNHFTSLIFPACSLPKNKSEQDTILFMYIMIIIICIYTHNTYKYIHIM